MNKKWFVLLIFMIFMLIGTILFTINKKQLTSYKTGKTDFNTVWVATFQLAWNDFIDNHIHKNIEFQDGKSELATKLNQRNFTKEMLSESDYYIIADKTDLHLKEKILLDIKSKFNINSSNILNSMDFRDRTNNYTLYAVLNKQFTFPKPFDKITQDNVKFNGGNKNIKLFGIKNSSTEELNDNVKVMFYNANNDFAVKIATIEGEELILYRTDNKKSIENLYNEMFEKEQNYNGSKKFEEVDELKIPYIKLNQTINYNELCNREIKDTNGLYIDNAIQSIQFNLTETGGNLVSEAGISATFASVSRETRYFNFTDTFILFLREKNKEKPYFVLLVDSDEILESSSIWTDLIEVIKQ